MTQNLANDKPASLLALSLTALGVVFGDLGTSPLYALQSAFNKTYGVIPTPANIFGLVSLFLWALFLMISLKYVAILMRASNHGEGGILSLLALLLYKTKQHTTFWIVLTLIGVAMLYGDGIITPAISVLSAVEGLSVATRFFDPYIVPITLAILLGLFLIQSYGSGRVGTYFGPLIAIWFICIALLGIHSISQYPHILWAFNPYYGIHYLYEHGLQSFYTLGAVVLCITGAEALYADMGHFGSPAIRLAWYGLVLPALVLNYLGQGALLILKPEVVNATFYSMVPTWGMYPMIVIATLATIVASQALISAVFSLTSQATQLGFSPRLQVRHTSGTVFGQIYLPALNWLLMVATIGLVLIFRSSNNLANAYGFTVSVTMAITTFLFLFLVHYSWKWSWLHILALFSIFMLIDMTFVLTNLTKLLDGAWMPMLLGAGVFLIMYSWFYGRSLLKKHLLDSGLSLSALIKDFEISQVPRVEGTAVFLTDRIIGVPQVLLHHLKHNRVLHKQVIVLTILTKKVPRVAEKKRIVFKYLPSNFTRIIASFGFMEVPSIPKIFANITKYHHYQPIDIDNTSFYLGRYTFIVSHKHSKWQRMLLNIFIWFKRNENSAIKSFVLPPNRVLELGAYLEL